MKYKIQILQTSFVDNGKIITCEISSGKKSFRRQYSVGLLDTQEEINKTIKKRLKDEKQAGKFEDLTFEVNIS